MSLLELQRRRNEARGYIEISNLGRKNSVRFGLGESIEHARTKFEICYALHKDGKEFYTEVVFKTGGRADILILDDFEIVELVKSETQESLDSKVRKYPEVFDIKIIKVGDGQTTDALKVAAQSPDGERGMTEDGG